MLERCLNIGLVWQKNLEKWSKAGHERVDHLLKAAERSEYARSDAQGPSLKISFGVACLPLSTSPFFSTYLHHHLATKAFRLGPTIGILLSTLLTSPRWPRPTASNNLKHLF